MKLHGYFLLILFTARLSLFATPNQQAEIDSLKLALVTTEEKGKPALYTSLSYACKNANQFEQSIHYGKQAIELANKYHQDSVLYEALMTTSESYLRTGHYHDANPNYFKALSIARKLKKYKNVARCYNQLALNYLDVSDYEKSIENFIHALSILEDSLPKMSEKTRMKYVALVTNNMGIVYNRMDHTEKALAFFTKSLEIRKKLKYQAGIASCLQNIAVIYGKKNEIHKELEYYNKALTIRKKLKNKRDIAELQMNIGTTQIGIKQYDKAFNNLMKAKRIFEKIGDKDHEAITLQSIANLYLQTGKPEIALPYIKKNLKLNKELHELNNLIGSYKIYQQYYAAVGNYKKAWLISKKVLSLKDSLNTVEVNNKINEIQTRYETEKKEKTIERLQKETEIKALKIKQKNLQLYVILAVVVLLFVLGYSLFSRYKLKQKQYKSEWEKKNMEIEQRLLRSQMNPHFMFNSMNSIQSFISSNNTFEAMTFLSKFAQLMRNILENSTKPVIPLSHEINTLKLYIDLERSRFKQKFDYRIDIEESIQTSIIMVPPMLIQPFVENAIKHGFRNLVGGGMMRIDFRKKSKWISCTVTDNGLGRSAASGNMPISEENHRSLGTQLTKERLMLLSKQQRITVHFQITDLYDNHGNSSGTKVVIRLPYEERPELDIEEDWDQ